MSTKDRRMKRTVRRSYIISTVSIALVLFMLGVVSYVTLSALSAARSLRGSVVVSVELGSEVVGQARADVLSKIEATGLCSEVEFLDRESKFADEEFRKQFEVDLDMLLGENPLRDSFEITLSDECATREQVEAFVSSVEHIAGVEYVSVPPIDVIEGMHSTISYVTIGLAAFFGVLLIISILLLNNTIRLAIYSKRYLINTMKLVGATKWYIMRPFLGSALKQGLIAGVVAAVMICGIVYGAESFTVEGLTMLNYREVAIIVGSVVAVGLVITLLFSIFAVNKFVNMKSSSIHLY